MAYVNPSSRSTGDVVTAAIWNQDVVANVQALSGHVHTGAAGDGGSSLGPMVKADFTDATAPAAPSSGQTRLYTVSGRVGYRANGGTAKVLVDQDTAETLTNKTLTSPTINTTLTGTAVGTGSNQVAAGNHTHAALEFYPHDPDRIGGVTVAAASNGPGDFSTGQMVDSAKRSSNYAGRFAAVPTSVKLSVIPAGTGDMAWYCVTDFGAAGEAYNANSDSIGSDGSPQTTAVTANQVTEIDVTDAFTGAAAGDYFGLIFVRDGDDASDTVGNSVFVIGLFVAY